MTWKLTAYAKTRQNYPGIPWRDLSDEEYATVIEAHPYLADKGYFEKATEEEDEPKKSSRSTSVYTPAIDKKVKDTDGR